MELETSKDILEFELSFFSRMKTSCENYMRECIKIRRRMKFESMKIINLNDKSRVIRVLREIDAIIREYEEGIKFWDNKISSNLKLQNGANNLLH